MAAQRRLTLRTLLAYLDDTLPAAEIKEFGQKVAESDAAQELVARIKQVTRRRRLTVPPASGPSGIDPNDVAEYLDDELPGDQVVELEKLAHESDVHLAEIASCHQILTLLLGEPALVPPKARERMYGLVQGREAIPYRKAQPAKASANGPEHADDLGLTTPWPRWILPAAAVLLLAALATAVYQVLPTRSTVQVARGPDQGLTPTPPVEPPPEKGSPEKEKPVDKTPPAPEKEKEKTPPAPSPQPPVNPDTRPPEDQHPAVVEHQTPPSKERMRAGTYLGGLSDLPTALLRQPSRDVWDKVPIRSQVFTAEPLVALPGFTSVVSTNGGVNLLLRGSVREFAVSIGQLNLLDSAVILHANPKVDLDLTLLRGRIYLTNRKEKGPCTIRLRFEKEVWDLSLDGPGDEVGVDFSQFYTPLTNYRGGEPPAADLQLAVIQGAVGLKVDAFNTYNLEVERPRWARVEWTTARKTQGPFKEARLPEAWSKQPPPFDLLPDVRREGLRRILAALKDLEVVLNNSKTPALALRETLDRPDPAARLVAISGLGAVDAAGELIDRLGDEDRTHVPDREMAFFVLQRWIARSPDNARRLYDEKAGTGLLLDRRFRKGEAATAYQLLHPLLAEYLGKVETYEFLANCLQHRKVAIAEMGYQHLLWLSPGVPLPRFNAADAQEERERYAAGVRAMIEKRQLPPAPPDQPAPGK
ncbi:MAG: hypothetical protein U0736_18305 [Gemmataceae bacterium]